MADNKEQNIQTVVVPGEAPPVDKALVARSIGYGIVLANAIAAHFGFHFHLNGNEDTIYNYVSDGLLVLSFVQAYWKNNSITKAARIIDKVAEQIDIFAKRNPVEAPTPHVSLGSEGIKVEAPEVFAGKAPVAEAPKADAPVQPAPEAQQAPAADQPK